MDITLCQSEISEAVIAHLKNVAPTLDIQGVDFISTRGGAGITAKLSVIFNHNNTNLLPKVTSTLEQEELPQEIKTVSEILKLD